MKQDIYPTYWQRMWQQYRHRHLGMAALFIFILFCVIGIYAPFLASSKPFAVYYSGEWFFPMFRYLFFSGFYTKRLDIFFNLMIFTTPMAIIGLWCLKGYPKASRSLLCITLAIQIILFCYFAFGTPHDPAADPNLAKQHELALQKLFKENKLPTWDFDFAYMTPYAKVNLLLAYKERKQQNEHLQAYNKAYAVEAKKRWMVEAVRDKKTQLLREGVPMESVPSDQKLLEEILKSTTKKEIQSQLAMPTLWQEDLQHYENDIQRQKEMLKNSLPVHQIYKDAASELEYIIDRRRWLEEQSTQLKWMVMPLISSFHWEDDAGGGQSLNQVVPWWDLTRINRKDLMAALIFGVRISLVVGVISVALALAIGIPIGALAGFYGGTFDIIVCRLLEIWESMPTFFMLLLVVAITQSKSIFLVIAVIGIFGWTGFSRYVRGEFFKQRNLPYVESCYALGFRDTHIIYSHILPNAIPPVLTLLPFAIMGAISSEAGLSFLGLGEEGSCSWGVLMDEGRTAFPGESYLLWPPAIALTILLIAIALIGDALRDVLDPKMR